MIRARLATLVRSSQTSARAATCPSSTTHRKPNSSNSPFYHSPTLTAYVQQKLPSSSLSWAALDCQLSSTSTWPTPLQVIPYSVLLEALSLPSVPVLEDLLIEAIYQGLLGARLDQREAQVEVTNSLGRDVRPSPVATPTATSATAAGDDGMELDASPAAVAASSNSAASSGQTVAHLGSALHAWLGTIHALLDSLSQHLAKVQADAVNERLVLGHQEDEVKRVLTEVTKESAGAGAKGKGKAREDDEGATGGVARGLAAMAGRMLGGGGKGKGSGVGKDDRAVGGVGEEEMEVDGEGGKGGAGAGRKGAARDAKRRRG